MATSFPHGYALLIGVGECAYSPWSLPTTVKDVRALHAALTDANLCAYPNDEEHIRLLHDSQATRAAIRDGLLWLAAKAATDPEATAVVYYSGHGWIDHATGSYYLLPHDVAPYDIPGSALPARDFTPMLRDIPAQRLLVVLDCCHAEGMASSKAGPASDKFPAGFAPAALPKDLVDTLKQGQGRAVCTSSRGEQRSWIRPDGMLSIYTSHLIEALQGAGNQPGDTTVRVSNLMNHLGKTVPHSARTLCQAEQTPFFDTAAEDFAIAMLRGGKGLPAGGWETPSSNPTPPPSSVVTASGERGVAIGGNVKDSPIITGDGNIVQQGKYNLNIDKATGLAIGDNAQVIQHSGARDAPGSDVRAIFAPLLSQVLLLPAHPHAEAGELLEAIERIRDEIMRGQEANLGQLWQHMKALNQRAPDIAGRVFAIIERSDAVIAEPICQLAATMRRSIQGPGESM